ncbi:recombinase family protein [Gammaproteobacteria bacterium]|nr:recombinase family protein [Gammaproteobacteria bacterium]
MYQLIQYLHEGEGLGYRKISQKLNSWGIKTQRNKLWSNTSVFSVLQKKCQRDKRIEKVRNKSFPIKISKLSITYSLF